MKLVTFYSADNPQPRPGILRENAILEIPYPDVLTLIEGGAAALENLRAQADSRGGLREIPLPETIPAPVLPRPRSLRDAYAFEQHVRTAHENRGRTVPEVWYQLPIFYYTNANAILGHDDPLPYPHYTQALDYELEIAAVIGKPGKNLTPEQAADHIFGFTIFNDWSARDVQLLEMQGGLGPAKGKDFASSLGPCIVTLDELQDRATDRPGVYHLAMTARLNGKTIAQGNFKDIYWSFGEILARISQEVTLYPGEVIGSGTVGSGCLLETTRAQGPWLQPGDVVELEIERIGILRNRVSSYGRTHVSA
ncbi:MAG: fumarylacetoacetate hydrolase family protein [Anaerolineales bacterium]